jgi:hypothetical protein
MATPDGVHNYKAETLLILTEVLIRPFDLLSASRRFGELLVDINRKNMRNEIF